MFFGCGSTIPGTAVYCFSLFISFFLYLCMEMLYLCVGWVWFMEIPTTSYTLTDLTTWINC